jgi:hypothetical protein
MKYSEKLRDPRWQRKRLEILSRDNWTCQACDEKEDTLHVHHLKYLRGRDPWDYEDKDLITLCEYCHEQENEEKYQEFSIESELRRSCLLVGQIEYFQYILLQMRIERDNYAKIVKSLDLLTINFFVDYFSKLRDEMKNKGNIFNVIEYGKSTT